MFDFFWKNRLHKLNFLLFRIFLNENTHFREASLQIFLSFGKTKIHDFHSGLFSRGVTSLFEKQTILYHAKFICLSFDMALCIFLASVSDPLN